MGYSANHVYSRFQPLYCPLYKTIGMRIRYTPAYVLIQIVHNLCKSLSPT